MTGAGAPVGQRIRRTCADGEVVFRAGEPSDYAYRILDGTVALSKPLEVCAQTNPKQGGPTAEAGDAAEVLGAGDLVGTLDVLDGSARTATATARGPVSLEGLDREALLASLRDQPDRAVALVETLASRWRLGPGAAAPAARSRGAPGPERRSRLRRPRRWFHGLIHRDDRAFRHLRLEFQPDVVEIEQQPPPRAARLILHTIVATLIAGVVWASLARLDRIVIAEGRIITDRPLITIQPLETAVIRSLPVQVGQIVPAGSVVAELDATFASADDDANRGEMVNATAIVARLEAELAETTPKTFSEESYEDLVQRSLFDSRVAERKSQRKAFDEELRELEARLRTSERDRVLLTTQRETTAELERMRHKLMAEGHGSRVNWLDARHQLQSADREIERQTNTLNELKHRMASARAKRDAFESEWRARAAQELAEARRLQARSREQVRKSERMADLVQLKAPARAMVLEIGPRAVGSVVREGETILSLVAVDVPLQAEVSITPKDIAAIRIGDEARIKMEAFPYQKHGSLQGSVRTLNNDVVAEEKAGRRVDVYKARIDIGTATLREVPADYALVAGMTVTAEIKVGTRRLITYILYPVMRTLDTAMREP